MIRRVTQKHAGEIRPASKTRKAIGMGAVLLTVALLMLGVLFVTVGCGGSSDDGPEATVQKFLTASENKDIDAVLEVLDPEIVAAMESDLANSGQTLDDVKEDLGASFFPFDSVKFEGVKMETTETGDDTATVTIVEGTLTETIDGVSETSDVQDSDEPAEFYLVRVDGQWYIDFDAM